LLATTLLFFLSECRSILRRCWQLSHVHVRVADFVFRRISAESLLRSEPILFAHSVTLLRVVPLGSFSGGFSSTTGYVPGNEALVRRRERRSTRLADHFQWALLVFIRVTFEKSEDFSSKPFGFGSGRFEQRLSAPTVRKLLRHRISSTSRYRSKCP
jgi:hypothetical protein